MARPTSTRTRAGARKRRSTSPVRRRGARRGAASRRVVLVDIDGTVADVSHRLHHLEGRKNWKAFFESLAEDEPIESIIDLVQRLSTEFDIVLLTGRPESYRRQTEEWLKHHGVPYTRLLMRPAGDHRPDFITKEQILRTLDRDRIELAIDDREPVCDMFRQHGIRTLEVKSDYANEMVNQLYELVGGEAKDVVEHRRPINEKRARAASPRRRA